MARPQLLQLVTTVHCPHRQQAGAKEPTACPVKVGSPKHLNWAAARLHEKNRFDERLYDLPANQKTI